MHQTKPLTQSSFTTWLW